ncbi:MAG: nucleotide exchange factor GrpE [bacterium]|nr:nucleotide exchange factor GrpE [bacterium]
MTAAGEHCADEAAEDRLDPRSEEVGSDGAPAQGETIEPDAGAPVPTEGTTCEQCVEYLDAVTRLKADFVNFRRRAAEQQAQASERGAADLASRLLAVLDASEAGAVHDSELVGPLHSALLDALTEGGLEVISPAGQRFDPNYHEAVLHTTDEIDGETPAEPMVTDVLRTGYAWGGRVLRPAVVGVRG